MPRPATIKPIKGFPGYLVGNDGSVWSKWRWSSKGNKRGETVSYIGSTMKQMKARKHNGGYLTVAVRKDGKYYYFLIHRLVLETFIGPCPEGMECLHGDGSRTNNRVENLRWGTRQENCDDMVEMDRSTYGERNARAKLTEDDVLDIVSMLKKGVSQSRIATKHGISQKAVSLIKMGVTWKRTTNIEIDNEEI